MNWTTFIFAAVGALIGTLLAERRNLKDQVEQQAKLIMVLRNQNFERKIKERDSFE